MFRPGNIQTPFLKLSIAKQRDLNGDGRGTIAGCGPASSTVFPVAASLPRSRSPRPSRAALGFFPPRTPFFSSLERARSLDFSPSRNSVGFIFPRQLATTPSARRNSPSPRLDRASARTGDKIPSIGAAERPGSGRKFPRSRRCLLAERKRGNVSARLHVPVRRVEPGFDRTKKRGAANAYASYSSSDW